MGFVIQFLSFNFLMNNITEEGERGHHGGCKVLNASIHASVVVEDKATRDKDRQRLKVTWIRVFLKRQRFSTR